MNTRQRGKDQEKKKTTLKSEIKKRKGNMAEPCMRCGAPVEREGDLLCKKCDGEVH